MNKLNLKGFRSCTSAKAIVKSKGGMGNMKEPLSDIFEGLDDALTKHGLYGPTI